MHMQNVNIDAWIDKASRDPVLYLKRQAVEIILSVMSKPPFQNTTYLKGGLLMGLVYNSPRETSDIDLTSTLAPTKIDLPALKATLNHLLKKQRTALGYLDLELSVQRFQHKPKNYPITEAHFPALDITIGYARKGSPDHQKLEMGKSTSTIPIEISFNEPVHDYQLIQINSAPEPLKAYSLLELLAEKIRAYLQQEIRHRTRRQDIYDLSILVQMFDLDKSETEKLHEILIDKCQLRGIEPNQQSLESHSLINRAKKNWDSLEQEIDVPLPTFDTCFKVVLEFYRSLPWKT